jgi:hypothetical protein
MRHPTVNLICTTLLLCCNAMSYGAETPEPGTYRGQGIVLHVSARTPEQMAAFYSARGFPKNAVQALTQTCFVTAGMRNERKETVWLELANWRFVDATGNEVRRLKRSDWDALWDQLKLPSASRATFGWTQMPESRDLQPGEPVGGNLTVVPPDGSFALEASFRVGDEPGGQVLQVRIPGIVCGGRGAAEGQP